MAAITPDEACADRCWLQILLQIDAFSRKGHAIDAVKT
jgi:hypothetical protein